MRFWTLLILIVLVITAIAENADVFEKVTFNPLGHSMDYKLYSDNEDFTRDMSYLENTNEPYWSGVNYGSLEALTTYSKDGNGSNQKQVGDSDKIVDMLDNANNDSKYPPTPGGLTIFRLPGIQSNNKADNVFSFKVDGNKSVIAPRNYYLSTQKVTVLPSAKGTLVHDNKKDAETISINVMQVPYGSEQVESEATGTATKASDSDKVVQKTKKSLDELEKLAKDNASRSALIDHLFKKDGGLSDSYSNINNMINKGNYADAYKSGMSTALGEKNKSMFSIAIKTTDNSIDDAFDQFNFIRKSLESGNNKYYSPALVKWAKANSDTIMHTLMVNYFFQVQFSGTNGEYTTPTRLNHWDKDDKGKTLSFKEDLIKKGSKTKEPFYLYTVINPKASAEGKTLKAIDSKYIVPDLSYIYSLYTGIHISVWRGASGKLNVGDGSLSQTWENLQGDMHDKVKKDKVEGANLPNNANKVSDSFGKIEHNNLVSGLSSQRGTDRKAGTASVYTADLEVVGALRTLLSKGEASSGNSLVLNGAKYKVTPIGDTKYTKAKIADSYLFSVYQSTGGDTYDKWATMVNATNKIPLSPAVFNSKWSTSSGAAAYVIMPVMLGHTHFPKAMKTTMDKMMTNTEMGRDQVNLSYTNRYIMAFNFKSDVKANSTNRSGVTEVYAGKGMGKALDTTIPIVLTGYLGGEEFSLVDYYKVYDSLQEGRDNPNLQVKGKDGDMIQMKYLNLFKDFFTVKVDMDLLGEDSKGTVKYDSSVNKAEYKSKYQANSAKSLTSQISPDYSTFFTGDSEEEQEDEEVE